MNDSSFAFPEVCMAKDDILATYYIETESKDVLKYVVAIAEEQTTSTWTPIPGENQRIRQKHTGKVTAVYALPDYEFVVPKDEVNRKYIVQIAFPSINFDPQIPMLLSSLIGNIAQVPYLKLMDIAFPQSWISGFKGPKFGIEGVRNLLSVHDRPFINNMIKPDLGWTPEEGAQMAYDVAVGGVDFVKDDELLPGNPSYCPLEDRVKAIMASLKRAYEETGEKTLYTPNITDDVSKLRDNALRAIDAGANALMMNFYTVGFSAAKMITEDPEINVPVMAHIDYSGTTFGSPYQGITSPLLVGKLARMAGADMEIITSPYGKFPVVTTKYKQQVLAARQEFFGMKAMLPLLSGGMTQGAVPITMNELGIDICLAAGGAIHGHPMGATAGAISMRQAVAATLQGVTLREYAKDHKELAAIVDTWGTENSDNLFDLKK
ncbi:MAG: RuBisCO large subunit C-terminal-like domain-containing protein [Eubacteriales bacterium]